MERFDITIQMYSADASGTQYVWEKVPAEEGDFVLYADAQATIAALEQRVKELKQWVQDQSTANLETMRHMDEMQSRAMDAEQQLTQRTAELEAAKQHHEQSENAAQLYYRELTRVKNRICEAAGLPLDSGYEPAIKHLQAELERVRALIKALPKVEGAVVVSNGYVKDSTRCHALFGADEDAALYAALLQHRQGMEG